MNPFRKSPDDQNADNCDKPEEEVSVKRRIVFEIESESDDKVTFNTQAHKKRKMGKEMEELKVWFKAEIKELKNEIDDKIWDRWDTTWERYAHARQTKFFYPKQNKLRGLHGTNTKQARKVHHTCHRAQQSTIPQKQH